MKWLRIPFILIILTLLYSPIVLAIDQPTTVTIDSAKVYQKVWETGDMLFVCRYNVGYTTTPTEDANDTFIFTINNGATLIESRPLNYYGYNVISIYFTAAQVTAKGLVWESAYTVKVQGTASAFPITIPSATRALTSADWISASTQTQARTYLATWVLDQAEILEGLLGVDLVTVSGTNRYLTSSGTTLFSEAIPGIEVLQIYSSSEEIPNMATVNTTGGLATDWAGNMGTTVNATLTNVGEMFGVSRDFIGSLGIIVGFLIITSIISLTTNQVAAGYVLASPILILGAYWGVIPLVWIFVIASFIVVLAGSHIYFRLIG